MQAIVAMSENRGIGYKGELPWPRIPGDLPFFKDLTTKYPNLVMGRKTFDTLPVLKGRDIYFLSAPKAKSEQDIPEGSYSWYSNSNKQLGFRLNYKNDVYGVKCINVFGIEGYLVRPIDNPVIVGGASIYNLFLNEITEFYVTHVNGVYEADTFMPAFEHLFSKNELIKELEGGHRIVRYSR